MDQLGASGILPPVGSVARGALATHPGHSSVVASVAGSAGAPEAIDATSRGCGSFPPAGGVEFRAAFQGEGVSCLARAGGAEAGLCDLPPNSPSAAVCVPAALFEGVR